MSLPRIWLYFTMGMFGYAVISPAFTFIDAMSAVYWSACTLFMVAVVREE